MDGNDVLAVYEIALEAVEKARKGVGPSFIVANTYRIHGHTIGDPLTYRKAGEVEIWMDENHDPILRFKKYLIKEEIIPEQECLSIEKEARTVIQKAVDFGMQSPFPTLNALYEDLYIAE